MAQGVLVRLIFNNQIINLIQMGRILNIEGRYIITKYRSKNGHILLLLWAELDDG